MNELIEKFNYLIRSFIGRIWFDLLMLFSIGFILYIVLIIFFGYFYTFLSMNPDEMSKDLNERGGYIPGVRPGKDTEEYLSSSIGKLTLAGSLFLIVLAALPVLVSKFTNLSL